MQPAPWPNCRRGCSACEIRGRFAIVDSARNDSGSSGDGVIFIKLLEECIRISNEESGSPAIG